MTKSVRLTREDWLETGLQLLNDSGEQALTLEQLCKATSRTKGSFYHHFKSHDDFINALLEYWQAKYTEQIIAAVDRLEEPIAQRRELDRLAANVDNQLERIIRNWSGVDERVRQTIKKVDDRRLDYLTNLIGKLGKLEQKTASELAIVEYAAFLGLQYLFPDRNSKQIEHFIILVTEIISSYSSNKNP
ncbi:MAG: TetR/AcrR family transcriptional regulator [Xenococcaceae cyanobacterium MO_188.B29]|nr:TetR/AcrR family transcriptional regulator [Xenococcaceae cyanobacterium MO_188.B29]